MLIAEAAYKMVKTLPTEEQQLLLQMLQKDFQIFIPKKLNPEKKVIISNSEAIEYLIKNVFCKNI
jgi:hypothetical protein